MRGSKEANYREELGTPPATLPDPPDWMRPPAKMMFTMVCQFLERMGTLAESDMQVVCRYAIVWDRWQEAERHLAETGDSYREVTSPTGELRFVRPTKWQAQSNDCHEQLRQLETVLGLTPADRTRLGYHAEKVVKDPMEEFMSQRG
jgi:P27 family predicted phage terminase small subunit